ncbi:MAG: hypothetical protein EXS58_01015 [Candidatus Latescibacteria bacterium]|nr:hypothetical protein [Candidatus Latescibacterota bacterium]
MAPDREVVSLVELMTTALPVSAASRTIGVMMQMLGPLFLDRLFPAGLFVLNMEVGDDTLRFELVYADAPRVRAALRRYGLDDELGKLFVNSALPSPRPC